MEKVTRTMKWEDFVTLLARLYGADEANGVIDDLLSGYEVEMDDGCVFRIADINMNVEVNCPIEVLRKAGYA